MLVMHTGSFVLLIIISLKFRKSRPQSRPIIIKSSIMYTVLVRFLFVLAALVACRCRHDQPNHEPQQQEEDWITPLNVTCMNTNCGSAYQTCLIHPKCKQLLVCLSKCLDKFQDDTSLMKSDTQTCIGTCTFTYADIFYTGFSRCLVDNKCINLPLISTKCRYPNEVSMPRKFQISDLKGGWWKVRGYNPAYDCIPCQHTFFDGFQFENDRFAYRPTFEALTVNSSHTLVNGSIYVDLENTAPGGVIDLDYYLFGIPVHLSWYALDGPADNSSVLVYYCGNVLTQWNIEGAMILSRSPVLPANADQQFSELVKRNTDLEYSAFCKPQLHPCPN